VKENVWHQWFLVGTVESETMLSRSALAHIFDNVKARASPSIRSAKRGLLFLHRNARSHFKFKCCIISCGLISFSLCSCAVGGRRVDPQAPEKSTECLQQRRPSSGHRCARRSPSDRGIAGGSGSECCRGGGRCPGGVQTGCGEGAQPPRCWCRRGEQPPHNRNYSSRPVGWLCNHPG
jgi:hypothetical protein